MRRLIVPVFVILLFAEIAAAVGIVMAQPGGFASLADFSAVSLGPERRQDVAPKSLPLNGQNANVTINSMNGQVIITGDPTLSEVMVQGTKIIHSGNDSDFDKINFTVAQEGSNIRIEASQANKAFNIGFGEQMLIRVNLPPALVSEITTTVGSADIQVKGLQNHAANYTFNTGSGDLSANDLQANKLTIKTGSGDLNLTNITGNLDTSTNSGDINLNGQNRLGDLSFQVGSGDINIAASLNPTGTGLINTKSGDVQLKLTDSKALGFDISTGSGDIDFKLANVGPVTKEKHLLKTGGSPVISIRTGSGDVTVE